MRKNNELFVINYSYPRLPRSLLEDSSCIVYLKINYESFQAIFNIRREHTRECFKEHANFATINKSSEAPTTKRPKDRCRF